MGGRYGALLEPSKPPAPQAAVSPPPKKQPAVSTREEIHQEEPQKHHSDTMTPQYHDTKHDTMIPRYRQTKQPCHHYFTVSWCKIALDDNLNDIHIMNILPLA